MSNAQEVKNRLDFKKFYISELNISSSDIKQTGDNWYRINALCPFHNDKNPGTLHFNNNTGYFYCFSCGEKGDVFSFYMKLNNVCFKEALTKIKERYL